MNRYLLIRNAGLAPIESFTILGLSTSRGEVDKIGQFGSGSKHGILALMRAGITARIFIGAEELRFTEHEAKMGEKDYKEIRYSFRGQEHKTGMCLDFGALDWESPEMAVREFVCNALDQGEKIFDCASVESIPVAHSNETRIFIPMTAEIEEYWGQIQQKFLHFKNEQFTEIIPARYANVGFFRRGVFVRDVSVSEGSSALFHYNFQDGRIDESRNMDGAAMANVAAKLIRKSPSTLQAIFSSFRGSKKWEHQIGHSVWTFDTSENQLIKAAWVAIHGNKPFAYEPQAIAKLMRKGIEFVAVPADWTNCLGRAGVLDAQKLLDKLDEWNGTICPPTEAAVNTFRRAWRWFERANLTSGKVFPEIMCFSIPMDAGNEKIGLYKDGVCYLNLDYDSNEQAAVEELAHYVTGAQDETRDIQDFAFKLATRIAKLTPSA